MVQRPSQAGLRIIRYTVQREHSRFARAQDYSAVVAKHRAENADITVVSHGIPESKVGLVGIMKIDAATGAR